MSEATDLVKFSPTDAAIAEMGEKYMGLTVTGIDDQKGLAAVHAARMVVKKSRVSIENRRKELKADALEFGRRVDSEAKRLTALLEPIETHLQAEEDRIEAEKEAIRNAARLKAEAEAKAKADAEAAAARAQQEAEQAAIRAEQERLAAERAALEAEKAKVEAERNRLAQIEAERQRAIAAEQERLAAMEREKQRLIDEEKARKLAEEQAKQRAAELEQARKEAAERAIQETEARLAREAKEKAEREKQRAEAAEKKRLRQESLRPDREKLERMADYVAAIEVPMLTKAPADVEQSIKAVLSDAAGKIRAIAAGLE